MKQIFIRLIVFTFVLSAFLKVEFSRVFALEKITNQKGDDEDMSYNENNEIQNASFEEGLSFWKVTNEDITSFYEDNTTQGKCIMFKSEKPYTQNIYQKVENLQPGKYYLTIQAKNSGGQEKCFLYAQTAENNMTVTALPVSANEFVEVTARGIVVGEEEILHLGVFIESESESWVCLDNVMLHREKDQSRDYTLLLGGDISELSYVESCGADFFDVTENKIEPVKYLSDKGWNIVRLRLYNNPGKQRGNGGFYRAEQFMNLEDNLLLAKRAKQQNMQIQFTFHYSDFWTNGETQNIPYEWQSQIEGLNEQEAVDKLEGLVYEYTKEVMLKFKQQDTVPEYVSLGNEIQGGILYPYATTKKWSNLSRFINAGYKAVKEVSPDTKVILHLDDAGNLSKYNYFFGSCKKNNINYDIIGASYYPFWTKKKVSAVVEFCNTVTSKYDKDIFIMETGFNFSETRPNGYPGQLGDSGPYSEIYESTPDGQRDFMLELINGLKCVEGGRCLGDLYWDPVMVDQTGVGWAYNEADDKAGENVVSNTTVFDFEHKALPVLNAYYFNQTGTTDFDYISYKDDTLSDRAVQKTKLVLILGSLLLIFYSFFKLFKRIRKSHTSSK